MGLSARVQESVSVGVGVPGLVKDPNCRRVETVHVAGGFGPDGLQPPARGKSVNKPVTRMGGVGHNSSYTPQSPGDVQVLKGWKDAADHLFSRAYDTLQSALFLIGILHV